MPLMPPFLLKIENCCRKIPLYNSYLAFSETPGLAQPKLAANGKDEQPEETNIGEGLDCREELEKEWQAVVQKNRLHRRPTARLPPAKWPEDLFNSHVQTGDFIAVISLRKVDHHGAGIEKGKQFKHEQEAH